jgi:hypothetical protein
MKNKTIKHTILLPAVVATVAIFSLAAIFPAVVAQDTENLSQLLGDNQTTLTDSSINMTSSTTLIMDNGTLDCQAIATELGGIGVPSGNVCDVVVVRQAPQVTGHNGLNLNQFTLMNSVLEFLVMPANATTSSGNSTTTTSASDQVYVMGDFALLETEMNDVLSVVKENAWTVTGIHNHMINEIPKTTFMHWEAQGNINEIVDQANQAFAETSIKG